MIYHMSHHFGHFLRELDSAAAEAHSSGENIAIQNPDSDFLHAVCLLFSNFRKIQTKFHIRNEPLSRKYPNISLKIFKLYNFEAYTCEFRTFKNSISGKHSLAEVKFRHTISNC